MVKRALYDYIKSFKWRNIVQTSQSTNNFSFWWITTYLIILIPAMTELFHESAFAIACYYLWVIPFTIGVIGIELFPLRLTKLIFLCPMSKAERRKYSYAIYWIRILVPVAIEIILGLILTAAGLIELGIVCMYVFIAISTFVVLSMVSGVGQKLSKESEKQLLNLRYFVFFLFCVMTQICTIMFMEEIMAGSRGYVYAFTIEMIIFLIIDFCCLRSLSGFIEKSIIFEEDFKIMQKTNQPERAR